jgi:hypothetical protein
LQDPISRKTHHKNRTVGVAQGAGPEFKPQYRRKKKKELLLRLLRLDDEKIWLIILFSLLSCVYNFS